MPYFPFTDEQKRIANNVDLPEFLRMRGEKLERAGKEYKLIFTDASGKHDSITMSGSTWFDHKNQIGGGPLRFVQLYYGMSFPEAMQALLGYTVLPMVHRQPLKETESERKSEFTLPEANTNMHRVYAYLIKQRFIKPDIISYFAKQRTIYEDKKHHNVVFVGLDEKGVPKQAHKRSTVSYGNSFRMTCEGSDTRYSFSYYGSSEKLYIFEAPIDMLSYLTLYSNDWEKNSYIAMNGVYENSVLTALTQHDNIKEIIICTDNDEGGIDAADRLTDILKDHGYSAILRHLPKNKDWNEDLKQLNGAEYLPAVPHRRRDVYINEVDKLKMYNCSPEKLFSRIDTTFKNEQYKYLAEYALAGSAFFYFRKNSPENGFLRLKQVLRDNYRPYTDKGAKKGKIMALRAKMKEVIKDFRVTARTREQDIEIARKLYTLADCAIRVMTEDKLYIQNQEHVLHDEQEQSPEEKLSLKYG